MYKKRKKRIKKFFIGMLAIVILFILYPYLKIMILDDLSSIKPQLREKILLTSLILEKPYETFDFYREKYFDSVNNTEDDSESSHIPEVKVEKPESSKTEIIKPDVSEQTDSKPEKKYPAVIDPDYRGVIEQQVYKGAENGSFVKADNIFVRNYTDMKKEDILNVLEKPHSLKFRNTEEPQVLIFHTHATEAFEEYDSDFYDTRNTWRSTDNNKNMTAVGDILENELKKEGIGVLHDYTHHDYPSYNGSYKRSAETVKSYLEKYPSIKLILDLHRDGVARDERTIVKSLWNRKDGQKAAQVMVVCACDRQGAHVPGWKENFRLGISLAQALEKDNKGMTRPVYFGEGRYNMNLSGGLLLLEFGTNANTLEEAKLTAEAVGKSMAKWIIANTEG